ncbi:MAG: protein kinase [Kofleriaceae bacterium]|nr:protein kinase [Kofleriaceae bacterium]MCL4224774.1 protein kinase [Myxococcales bacterium]
MTPESIGGYRLERKLGAGGMGQVFVAVHPQLGYRVALKLLLPELSRQPEIVARFVNEARAASHLAHPGIARVFDFGYAEDGAAFFTMELLAGESLADRLRSRRVLTPGEALTISRQVATALGAAHASGIIHRDVKPDNVFLVADPDVVGGERAKLLDFGIAKLAQDTGNPVRTRTGTVMGTPYYMSPEQCRGAALVDARSDVYSVGCMLFEMVCGRPPFLGEGVGEILAAHQFLPPPDPRALGTGVSEELAALIEHTLVKDPRHRLASMTELAERCQALLDRGGGMALPASRPPALQTTLSSVATEVSRPPSRRALGLALGGVGVVAAIVAVVVAIGSGGSSGGAAVTAEPAADAAATATPTPPPPGWVVVDGATSSVALGVDDGAPAEVRGFRPARKVTAPREAFLIQAHEVTWAELATRGEVPARVRATDGWERQPATGLSWSDAAAHCRALGGSLPSEEQWEWAARGPDRRPHPWGDKQLDLAQTATFRGERGEAAAVGSSTQDRTPPGRGGAIHDLAGNAQEWTADLWREDLPGEDESWVQAGGVTFRAVRGLPLLAALPDAVPATSATYREPLCATGPCPEDTERLRQGVGFRCVRPWP